MAESIDPAQAQALPLDLRVLHGSLLFAKYPVLVGHYRGDPVGGAEGYLDYCLGGRLSDRQVLDRYPREIGDVVRITNDGERPPGALVVGLGGRGELTAAALARAVREAALEHALRWLERQDERIKAPARGIGISSVLIGSFGYASLTLPESVVAIVEGVALANDILMKRRLAEKVCIGELEFVELYATPAEEAAHVIHDIREHVPATLLATVALNPARRMVLGAGRRPARWATDYGAGIWRRLIISGNRPDRDGRMRLDFTSLGAQASAEKHSKVVDTTLVGKMLRESVQRPMADRGVATALFEMLFPHEIKRELASAENVQLVLDDFTADFPWEALNDRGSVSGAAPLARRAGLLRQLQVDTSVQLDVPSGVQVALVIGDPPANPAEFDRLPGARREAQAVAERLRESGMTVRSAIFEAGASPSEDPGSQVLGAFYATDYQIVHIASHGYFAEPRGSRPPVGGVVIGPGEYLTADMFASMRRPPDIVFLNCCHLASVSTVAVDDPQAAPQNAFVRQNANRLAASVSRQLMALGVKVVIAAGWSVMDDPAAAFATTFYEKMLAGETLGDAVQLARDAAHQVDGGQSNTWAAYQCYGDPGFRIATKAVAKAKAPSFVSADELVRALDDLAISAGEADDAYAAKVEATLNGHLSEIKDGWERDAQVLSAIGNAYGQLRNFEKAVGFYRRALACDNALLPIKAVEQLANFEHRLAMWLRAEGREVAEGLDEVATIDELHKTAAERLDALDGLGETADRRTYRGAWHKREALVSPSVEEATHHLSAAAREYLGGWRLSGSVPCNSYGAYNALQLVALGAALGGPDLDELVATLAVEPPPGDDFFERAAGGDRALTQLCRGELTEGPEAVATAYRQAFAERSSPVERNSVIRHIADLAALADKVGAPTAAELRRLADILSPPGPKPATTKA